MKEDLVESTDEAEVKETSEGNKDNTNKSKKRKWFVVAIILLLLLLLCWWKLIPDKKVEDVKPVERPGIVEVLDGDLPTMSDEAIKEYLKKKQDASMFTIQVNSEASFKEGSKTLSLLVANPEKNTADCFVELLYNGEVILTTPTLKPKQFIQTAELSKALPSGNNKVIVRYNVVYKGSTIGVVEAEITATSK
jgi:hypothetical protein